jgi:hypothetical protein
LGVWGVDLLEASVDNSLSSVAREPSHFSAEVRYNRTRPKVGVDSGVEDAVMAKAIMSFSGLAEKRI